MTASQAHPTFRRRLSRFIGALRGRRDRADWEPEALRQEQQFLTERLAALGAELERRCQRLARTYPDLGEPIERYARDPLPERWESGGSAGDIERHLRPLRREIDVLEALHAAVAKRPLAEVIEGALRRVEEDQQQILGSLRRWQPGERYHDRYWSDELLEQILSHLLQAWWEWSGRHRGRES
jgi:hypothetical protein